MIKSMVSHGFEPTTTEIIVGRWACAEVRAYLYGKSLEVTDHSFRWTESRGWFRRTFTITGPEYIMRFVRAHLAWLKSGTEE